MSFANNQRATSHIAKEAKPPRLHPGDVLSRQLVTLPRNYWFISLLVYTLEMYKNFSRGAIPSSLEGDHRL